MFQNRNQKLQSKRLSKTKILRRICSIELIQNNNYDLIATPLNMEKMKRKIHFCSSFSA